MSLNFLNRFLLFSIAILNLVLCFHIHQPHHSDPSIVHLNHKGNILELDLIHGGKINSLILKDPSGVPHQIIKAPAVVPDVDFTSNGCFMMYPWVNRLDPQIYPFSSPIQQITPDILDSNGVALHGLFANHEREIVEIGEDYVVLRPKDYDQIYEKNPFTKNMPKFLQWFQLKQGRFSLLTEFFNDGNATEGFSYGYHPYLQLDENSIDQAKIQTDMTHVIKVDEKLLPIPSSNAEYQFIDLEDLIKSNATLKGLTLDNCLINNKYRDGDVNYLNILFESQGLGIFIDDSKEKLEGKILSAIKDKEKINLRYFHVYTPNERMRLAVEAQSSGANAYYCGKEELIKLEPGKKGRYGVFNVVLKEI